VNGVGYQAQQLEYKRPLGYNENSSKKKVYSYECLYLKNQGDFK
jgi:hypothetical protein